jgi:hypothetical protein
MAHRRRLTLIAVGVLAAHMALIEWFGRELAQSASVLQEMAPPMFTRLLQQEAPPVAVAAAPKPTGHKREPLPEGVMAAAMPPASAPRKPKKPAPRHEAAKEEAAATPAPAASVAQADAATPVLDTAAATAAPAAPASSAPDPSASSSAVAGAGASASAAAASASSPASAASPSSAVLASWPADARVTYQLAGDYRGPLYGEARVQWQREGDKYQVKLEIEVRPWLNLTATSQGKVTDGGLAPKVFEETRSGKRRSTRFAEDSILLDGGKVTGKPEGVQDMVSQFVDLSHRFSTGHDRLEVGKSVTFWMARPGGVDRWIYDIVGNDILQTPNLGAVEAFHLKPRPLVNPRGDITVEMWFAPTLQYLPVRLKVLKGTEAYVDLTVDRIEQR